MSERDPLRRRASRRPPTGTPSLSKGARRLTHWLLIFFACALLLNALVGDNGFLAMRQARRDYDLLQARVDAERADNARLQEEARLLREDPETIKDAARRELGLIAPGERLFILKDVPPPKP